VASYVSYRKSKEKALADMRAQRRQLTPAEFTKDEGGVLLEDELALLEQRTRMKMFKRFCRK